MGTLMFLRNWESIQAIRLTGSVEASTPTVFGEGSKAIKGYDGSVAAGSITWFGYEKMSSSTYYSSVMVCGLKLAGIWTNASGAAALDAMNIAADMGPVLAVGSGTAEADYGDYTLTDITGLTHTSYTYGKPHYDASDGSWTGWVTRTLTNATGAEVTVNEIGVYLPLYCGYTSSNVSMVVLVYREKLSVPVVMQNGDSFSFGLKFKMPV